VGEGAFALSPPLLENIMINISGLLNAIEFQLELQELYKLNLTKDDIDGFIDFFFESWVDVVPIERGV
jgi:hypothetical protein